MRLFDGVDAARVGLRAGGVSAIVTLSAVRYADGTDLLPRARRLELPMLHVGSRGDPDTLEGEDTRALRAAGRVVLVEGDAHGTELVAEQPELVATSAPAADASESGEREALDPDAAAGDA